MNIQPKKIYQLSKSIGYFCIQKSFNTIFFPVKLQLDKEENHIFLLHFLKLNQKLNMVIHKEKKRKKKEEEKETWSNYKNKIKEEERNKV